VRITGPIPPRPQAAGLAGRLRQFVGMGR
jgi:hypothetical protein